MGRNHLRVLGALPGVRLAAVADPDAGAPSPRPRAATGAQAFSEPLAMLAEADLDAVVIAAPTTTHLPLTLAAIERGIAVLVEKPLAATPAEADRHRRRGVGAPARRRSRSAISSGSTRPSSSSAGCSRPAGCRPSSRSRAGAPGRSRPASATSG